MASKISKLIADAVEMYQVDRFDTEVLLSHALKKPREWVVANPDFFVPWVEDFKFQKMVKERSSGMPVAYLTGHKEFFGFDFVVNKDTLIPRPDTEILVEDVLQEVEKVDGKKVVVIDIGTGSGCIPVSLLKTLKNRNSKIPVEAYATDISKKALAIAKKNAHKYFVEINFFDGNLIQPIIDKKVDFIGKEVFITANLPYLTEEQFESEPSIQPEPHCALVADDQGLALYKELLEQIKIVGAPMIIYCEIDPEQKDSLPQYILSIFPNARIEILKDLCGRERVVKMKI